MKASLKTLTAVLGATTLLQVALIETSLAATPITTTTPTPAPVKEAHKGVASLLENAQRLFYKKDNDGALSYLQKYFSKLLTLPKAQARSALRFYAIAAMGRIYLQYKQDPAAAIAWFEKQKKTATLSEAEQDILSGWIAAAKDWQTLGKFPKSITSEDELFSLGQKYYEAGLKKQAYPMDQKGTADFSIASSFLVPFLVHHDKSPRIGEALYMMGDMRRRLWTSNEYWSENYYLSETIRRFPGTPLAQKAYGALEEDVHFGYSGSGGDNTPASWVEMLGILKKMAEGAPTNKPDLENKPVQLQ